MGNRKKLMKDYEFVIIKALKAANYLL